MKSSGPEEALKIKVKSLSHVQLPATPWAVAHQAPLSMGFSRQEHWSGLPFTSPGDLPDPGSEPWSPALQADSLPSELPEEALLQAKLMEVTEFQLIYLKSYKVMLLKCYT